MSEHYEVFDEPGVREFKALMADPAARQAFVELRQQKAENGARRSYEHVARALEGTIWAIRDEMLPLIVDMLAYRVAGGGVAPLLDVEAAARREQSVPDVVAVIPVEGTIVPKMDIITAMFGGTSVTHLRGQLREAMSAPNVKGIVLDIDSHGGRVDLLAEVSADMRAMRGRKPIVAVANTLAASAAYYIAAQADEVVATPSALLGSIGTKALHVDVSKAEEMEGVKTTVISAGKFKAEDSPYEPLSDDARAHMQSLVDNFYSMFVSDVAKGRGVSVDVVRSGFGQGRLLSAKEAVSEGLADRVATFDDVIRELVKGNKPAGRLAAMQPALEAPYVATTFTMSEGDVLAEVPVPVADEQPEASSGDVPEEIEERDAMKRELLSLME